MRRLLTFTLGVVLGAAATWWMLDDATAPSIKQSQPKLQPTATSKPATPSPAAAGAAPFTFAELGKIRSDYQQTYALYQLMDGRDANGIEGLLDQAKSQLNGDDYVAASAILYGRLAELNPQRAVERVLQAPGTAQSSWLSAVFHSWARLDLDAALAAAGQLSGPFKQIAGRAVLRSRGDLSGAIRTDIASDLSLPSQPISRGSDFNQAWQEAIARPDLNQQAQGLMQIAAMWASSDPAAAMEATAAIAGSGLRQSIQAQVAMEWARQDPGAAFEWIRGQGQTTQGSRMVQQVFQVLATADAQQARARAEQLSGTMQTRAMLGVLGPLAIVDQQAASDWLEQQRTPNLRMEAIQTMAITLAQRAPDQASQWIDTLPDDDAYLADMMLSSVLVNIDPEQAARRVVQLEDPKRRQRAAISLISNWAYNDAEAAAKWIGAMPEDERGMLYQSLASQWSQLDSDAALRFIDRVDADIDKDHIRAGVLGSGAAVDQALRLYDDIDDPQLKQQAGQQLYYLYQQTDPEQAERFRHSADLDIPSLEPSSG